MKLAEHICDALNRLRVAEWMDFLPPDARDEMIYMRTQELIDWVDELNDEIKVAELFIDKNASDHTLLCFTAWLKPDDITDEEIAEEPSLVSDANGFERITIEARPTFFWAPDVKVIRAAAKKGPYFDDETDDLAEAFSEALGR